MTSPTLAEYQPLRAAICSIQPQHGPKKDKGYPGKDGLPEDSETDHPAPKPPARCARYSLAADDTVRTCESSRLLQSVCKLIMVVHRKFRQPSPASPGAR